MSTATAVLSVNEAEVVPVAKAIELWNLIPSADRDKILERRRFEIVFADIVDMDILSKKAPAHWKVRPEDQLPNVVSGKWEFDPQKIKLYLSAKQAPGKSISGPDLCKELEGQLVFNDNLLDFFEENPKLIPKEYRGKWLIGWGRIYRDSIGSLYVRYLYVVDVGSCGSHHDYVASFFSSNCPAPVASK